MKKTIFFALGAMAVLSACKGGDGEYDASGVFETTEVTVSAQGMGEIMDFYITEGETVSEGQVVGHIDTI